MSRFILFSFWCQFLGVLLRIAGYRQQHAEQLYDILALPRSGPEEVPSFATSDDAKRVRHDLVANGGPMVQLMIGNAIGDAFGFMIEFDDAYWIRENVNISDEPLWPVRTFTPHWVSITTDYMGLRGMYSDDAEMTVGLMKALMKYGQDVSENCMLRTWKEEWDLSGQRPMQAGLKDGEVVKRSGHGSIIDWYFGRKSIDRIRKAQLRKPYPGNAPPMRSLPLGFLPAHKREVACSKNAEATHPHKKAGAASFLIATAVDWLVSQKGDTVQLIEVSLKALKGSRLSDKETEKHLGKLENLPDWHDYGARFSNMPREVHELLCGPQPFKKDTEGFKKRPRHGLTSDSMRTAGFVLYITKWQRNPREALLASVDVGGDVDSTAALVLGLIGGSTGLRLGEPDGIPWWMVESVEGVEYLHAQASKFDEWVRAEANSRREGVNKKVRCAPRLKRFVTLLSPVSQGSKSSKKTSSKSPKTTSNESPKKTSKATRRRRRGTR